MAGFLERSTTSNSYDNHCAYGLFIRTQNASMASEFIDHAVKNAKHAERHMQNDLRYLYGRKRGKSVYENIMD